MSNNSKFRFAMLTVGLTSVSAAVLIPTITLATIQPKDASGIKSTVGSFIQESSRKYTTDEFRQSLKETNDLRNILAKDFGTKAENVQNLSLNGTSLSFKLINIEKKKYSTSEDVIIQELENEPGISYAVTVKNLNFYRNAVTPAELKKLWNDVNQVIINNKVTVATTNPADANYEQHESKIIDVISNFGIKNEQTLGDHWNQEISRNLASITLKLDSSLLSKNELVKFGNFKLDEGYISVEENGTVHLNNLAFSSPEKYFTFSNGNKQLLSGISEAGRKEVDILIPYGVKEIKSNTGFYGNNIMQNVIVPDTVTSLAWGNFKSARSLEYVKLSRNIKTTGIQAFTYSGVKKVDMFEGLEEIGEFGFYGCKLGGDVVLPKSVKTFQKQTFQHSTGDDVNVDETYNKKMTSLKTWTENLPLAFLSRQTELKYVYLMANKIDVNNIVAGSFLRIPINAKIFVKNETIRNNIIEVTSKYTGTDVNIAPSQIIVNPNLK